MNEQTLHELKVLVERAVRPVAANGGRKKGMRDELLAHVTSAFEEEFAKTNDEQAALRKAAERFGDPAELTRELQQSVSSLNRIQSGIDQIWSRPGEAWPIRAFRQAMIIELLMLAFMLLPWLLAGAPTKDFRGHIFKQIGPELIAVVVLAACFPFLGEWMTRALYGARGRSRISIALLTSVCGLMFLAFSFWLDGLDTGGMLLATAYGAIWMPIALACMAKAAQAHQQYEQEWAGLTT